MNDTPKNNNELHSQLNDIANKDINNSQTDSDKCILIYKKIEENKEDNLKEIKSKFKTNLIIAIISLITLNILLVSGAFLVYKHKFNISVEQAYKKLYANLDEILTDDVKQRISNEVLQNHIREYYLPEDYFSIGVYVNKNARPSVVEVMSGGNQTNPTIRATGIILNADGYIITNAHAVTFGTEHIGGDIENPTHTIVYTVYEYISVAINNEYSLFRAEVIEYDINKDLAIIKLQNVPDGLNNVTLTSSDYVSKGEECVIMGNTLGLGITVSIGTVLGTYKYEDMNMLQLDALALEGNSGAGVFNPYCELTALVSFKKTSQSDTESICYAVSSNEIMAYIEKISNEKALSISYTLSDKAT